MFNADISMDNIEEILYKGYTIQVMQDDSPEDPREWDNLGKMVCFHKRYELGDKKHGYDKGNFDSWDELRTQLEADGAELILPLGLYDHSGISMYIGDNHDRWDGGQVGFIVAFKKDILRDWPGYEKNKAKVLKIVEGNLRGEVETYNDYLTGNVYGFIITDPEGEEITDGSTWGYFGDYNKDLLDEAKSRIDYEIKTRQKKAETKLKAYIRHHVPLMARV